MNPSPSKEVHLRSNMSVPNCLGNIHECIDLELLVRYSKRDLQVKIPKDSRFHNLLSGREKMMLGASQSNKDNMSRVSLSKKDFERSRNSKISFLHCCFEMG